MYFKSQLDDKRYVNESVFFIIYISLGPPITRIRNAPIPFMYSKDTMGINTRKNNWHSMLLTHEGMHVNRLHILSDVMLRFAEQQTQITSSHLQPLSQLCTTWNFTTHTHTLLWWTVHHIQTKGATWYG